MKSLKVIAIVIITLVVVALLVGVLYFYFNLQKMRFSFEENWSEGSILQIEISCISGLNYTLAIKNNSSEAIPANNLNFYIDKTKITCEGLNDLEPNASSACTISQYAAKGSHSFDVSGPNFSMGRTVNCP